HRPALLGVGPGPRGAPAAGCRSGGAGHARRLSATSAGVAGFSWVATDRRYKSDGRSPLLVVGLPDRACCARARHLGRGCEGERTARAGGTPRAVLSLRAPRRRG